MDCLRLEADYVIVSERRILHPGQVVIRRGRIVAVDKDRSEKADIILPDSVLMPGLINAHTHLEFSDLSQPFPAGPTFPAWISNVVAHRRESAIQLDEQQATEARRAAILAGITEAKLTGTHVLGDIVSYPWQPADLPTRHALAKSIRSTGGSAAGYPKNGQFSPERENIHLQPYCAPVVIAFAEMIGLTPERSQATSDWAADLLSYELTSLPLLTAIGISPHAPYSVLMPIIRDRLAKTSAQVLTAMHLAESREELELLEHGSGPFRDSFAAMNIPLPPSFPTIEACVQLLAARRHGLLVHGNYLTESQIELAARSQTIHCVYCPRTHRHFGHEPYPLQLMQKHGLPVVLGTDSRASSPDLNLWSEVIAARNSHPELSPELALAAVTSKPARALGLQGLYGSIEPGKTAALNVVPRQAHWSKENLLEELTSTPLAPQPIELKEQ